MTWCDHCSAQGDLKRCQATDCDMHQSWYAQSLRAELAEATKRAEDAERCESIHAGLRCGDVAGHTGPHTVLVDSSLPWAKKPQIENLAGIDITGNELPEDYIRKMKD